MTTTPSEFEENGTYQLTSVSPWLQHRVTNKPFLPSIDMYQNMDGEGGVVMTESPFTQLYDSVIYTGASLIQRTSNLTVETTTSIVGFIESSNEVSSPCRPQERCLHFKVEFEWPSPESY
jgi:hypothetical protein